jgi:hypothetical protein
MGVGGQLLAPAALTPGITRYPLYRRLCGPHSRSVQVRKILLLPGFDPITVHPKASRYTDWAILSHAYKGVTILKCLVCYKPKGAGSELVDWSVDVMSAYAFWFRDGISWQARVLSTDHVKPCHMDLVQLISGSCGIEMHMTDASGLRQIKHDNEMWAPLFATKRKILLGGGGGGGGGGGEVLFSFS